MTDAERLPAISLTERIAGVEVFRWMPRRFASVPEYQPENFGDSLAREIVAGMVAAHPPLETPRRSRRLLSIGSILHFARGADTIWGSGINGKVDEPIGSVNIDVRAVRGPKTRAALLECGVAAPETYGDPGLLLPDLFPVTRTWAAEKRHKLAIVPNFNDALEFAAMPDFVNPLGPLWDVIRRIAQSEFVVASSLHGIIVAEALGVPVRPLRSTAESVFKYDDYAQGTGRDSLESVTTVADALAVGPIAPLQFDTAALRASFPYDLWQNFAHTHILEAGAARDPEVLRTVLASAGDRDELVLSISNTADKPMAPLRAIAAEHPGVRLIGTPQETRGARLNAALSWARGATLSILGEGEQRISGSVEAATDMMASSGAAIAFTRVQEFGDGPDAYDWAGRPSDDTAESLSARTDLVTFRHPSGMVFDADAARDANWQFADRDDHIVLAPLIKALATDLPIVALETVSTLHRRDHGAAAGDLGDTLDYFGRVLALARKDSVRESVMSLVPETWRAAIDTGDSSAVREAAVALLDALPRRPRSAENRRTAGFLCLAGLGFSDLAAAGFGHAAGEVSIERFAAATAKLNRAAGDTGATDAAGALLSLTRSVAQGASESQFEALRVALLDLDLILRPDSSGKRHEGDMAGILTAALRRDMASLGVLLSRPEDVLIDRAVQTPIGWAVSGTAEAKLADPNLRVWVQDAGAGTQQIVGRLRFGKAASGSRVPFTGIIRSIGAPAGMLVLRPKHGGPSVGMETGRRAAGKFVHQMLHPVELPLDGGQALLVRRTLPTNAVRARARQQA